MKKNVLLLSLVALAAFGCNRPLFGGQRSNSSSTTPTPFTLETLKNANYHFVVKELADVYPKDSLKLTNGLYYFALPQGAARDEYVTKLDDQHVAFGDLNNDGHDDAAVILTSMAGKDRVYPVLSVMLNQNGSAEFVAGAELGQGVKINSLSIKNGKIEVAEILSGSNDSKTLIYRLDGSQLVQE